MNLVIKEIKNKHFAIIYDVESHYVKFYVLEKQVGEDIYYTNFEQLTYEELLYLKNKSDAISNEGETLEDKCTYGIVKWDGCSNWDFGGKNTKIHFCSVDDAEEMFLVTKECYKMAKEFLNNFLE